MSTSLAAKAAARRRERVQRSAEPEAGWPRPRGVWLDERRQSPRNTEPEALPVPWVLERLDDGVVAWTTFHGQAHTAHTKRLCQVCGEELGGTVLLGLAEHSVGNKAPRTSGPGCHPRCMALTLSFCPHFRDLPEDEVVAFAYQGSGVGYLVVDEPSDEEPTELQIEEVYTGTVRIVDDATPLCATQIKEIARLDPLGWYRSPACARGICLESPRVDGVLMSEPVAPLKRLPKTAPVPGWPRPWAEYIEGGLLGAKGDAETELLPVPWVLECNENGIVAWTVFHGEAHRAHRERLCQVCGEALGHTILLGNAEDAKEPRTSGPGCHPRCMALAIGFCPHFREAGDDDAVAFAYQGKGLGYRLFDSCVDEGTPTVDEIEGAYQTTVRVVADVKPLNKEQVKDLARGDPLGADVELIVDDYLHVSKTSRTLKRACVKEGVDGELALSIEATSVPEYAPG